MGTIPCFWCRDLIEFGDDEDAPTYCVECAKAEDLFSRPRPKPTREQLEALAEVIEEHLRNKEEPKMKFEQKPDGVHFFSPGKDKQYLWYFPDGKPDGWKPPKSDEPWQKASRVENMFGLDLIESRKQYEERKLKIVHDKKRRRGAE